MRKRIRLRRKSKMSKKDFFFVVIILVIIAVYFSLKLIGNLVTPFLLETSELEIQRLSSIVANQAISDVVKDSESFLNLFETVTSSDGTIQTIDFNPIVVNELLNLSTNLVLDNLRELENGNLSTELLENSNFTSSQITNLKKGIVEEIPFGLITKNPLLANLGPKIPVRLHFIGDVLGNITTNIESYGINNALIQIGIHFEVTVQILLPYLTEEKTVSFDIPLSIKMIQGKIPTYYSGGFSKDSALYTLPVD